MCARVCCVYTYTWALVKARGHPWYLLQCLSPSIFRHWMWKSWLARLAGPWAPWILLSQHPQHGTTHVLTQLLHGCGHANHVPDLDSRHITVWAAYHPFTVTMLEWRAQCCSRLDSAKWQSANPPPSCLRESSRAFKQQCPISPFQSAHCFWDGVEPGSICFSVTGLFHFLVSPTLQHMAAVPSLLKTESIPLYA